MNRLPSELRVDIFGRLVFKDKLQCALSCRDWYTKIVSSVLYSEIRFKYSQSDVHTRAIINYMHDKNAWQQVKELYMSKMDDPLELSELFPALKSLQVNKWTCDDWNDCNNMALAQNWSKLEDISDHCSGHLLTMKLLSAHLSMKYLSSLTISVFDRENEVLSQLFEQLKYAPTLERLRLLDVASGVDFEQLDLLHENTPNLKHLELQDVDIIVLEEDDNLDEHCPLDMNSSIASNLRLFSAVIEAGLVEPSNEEISSVVHWIEYACRKYTDIISVNINVVPMMTELKSSHNQDIITNYLKEAFCSWTQLKKFAMQPLYLSADILQAMDNCDINLEELVVYIDTDVDMEQFINLAHSKQRQTTKKLIIDNKLNRWPNRQHLEYFFQLLNKAICQLKAIDILIQGPNSFPAHHNVLTPIQVLDYIPSLQRLFMPYVVTTEQARLNYNQTTRLTHLQLDVYQDVSQVVEFNTLQHIQDLIDNSPLLRSFSIYFCSNIKDVVTLDLQRNTRLTYVHYKSLRNDIIKIIQNDRLKLYLWASGNLAVKEKPPLYFNHHSVSLQLPPNIGSLSVGFNEFPL